MIRHGHQESVKEDPHVWLQRILAVRSRRLRKLWTLVVVIEMSLIPGIQRHPLKKAVDEEALALLHRLREAGTFDAADCGLRGGPRRLLAGALAARPRGRDVCDACDQHSGEAGPPAGEDRPAGLPA